MMIACRARKIYAALMALTGALLAIAINTFPVMLKWPVSPIMMIVAVSLLVDVTILALASRGQSDPLDMNGRIIGFFAAAAIYVIVSLTLSGGAGLRF
jgi:hypothetical protein